MGILKNLLNTALASLGYELIPFGSRVSYTNFLNVVKAYEQRLNEQDKRIYPNDTRPKLLSQLQGTPPSEAYFIIQALAKCESIDGDACEFGVAQGETSALIANEISSFNQKRLHLFDSFEGLPKPSEKDHLKHDIFSLGSMEAYEGTMSCSENMVRSRLAGISFPQHRYLIHRGFIEDVINIDDNLPKQVCFAYVDFDFYNPIKMTLEFLHLRTPTGAIIIVDDYDFFSSGAKTAVDEFINEKNSVKESYDFVVPDKCYGHFAILTKKV